MSNIAPVPVTHTASALADYAGSIDISWYFRDGKKATKAKREFCKRDKTPTKDFDIDDYMGEEYVYVDLIDVCIHGGQATESR
jgi:hypothetical protein